MPKPIFYRDNLTVYKIAVVLLALLSYFFFKPLILCLFPGLLFLFYNELKTNFFESLIYSVAFSISYWAAGFWLLKYIPVSFSDFIFISFLASIVLVLLKHKGGANLPHVSKKDCLSVALTLIVPLLLVPLYQNQLVPSGVDMSTHSYIARLIAEVNGFPKSYEPLAPSNHWGMSPIGMPILMAALTKLSNLAINQSALIITIFTYFLFGASLYLFLVKYFSQTISFLAVLSAIWLAEDLKNYLYFGGIPTILSIALLVFAVTFALKIIDLGQFSKKNAFFLAVLIYGGFTSHHIPPVVLSYFLFTVIVFEFNKLRKNLRIKHLYFLSCLTFFLIIFVIPFLSIVKLPSPETLEIIKEWQRRIEYSSWEGNIKNILFSIPLYFQGRLGEEFYLLGIVGIFISLKKKSVDTLRYVLTLFATSVLIVNSKYWVLPLSPLLYPDRVVTLAVIPFSYFVAETYRLISETTYQFIKSPKTLLGVISMGMALIFLLGVFLNKEVRYYREFYQEAQNLTLVTQDDLIAFEWISRNTSENDVFLNNSGDAGIWIPSLATRKIIYYDATPYDIVEFRENTRKLRPNYLFLGSKAVYDSAIFYTQENVENNPNYEPVYSSGSARIYKIKNYEPVEQ